MALPIDTETSTTYEFDALKDLLSRFNASPQQIDFFRYILSQAPNGRAQSAVLEAVAGAGKTTSLVKGMELMFGEIFVGAFNTKIAKEIKGKTSHLPNVKCGTFHSAGMGALRKVIRLQGDPDGLKVRKIVDAWIAEKDRLDIVPLRDVIAKCVSMAKQTGIGAIVENEETVWIDMIEQFDLMDDVPEEFEKRTDIIIKLSQVILARSTQIAKDAGLIDFDDMIYLPLKLNLKMRQYDWVLIDEAQDTNPVRRELAKKMLAYNGRLIAVGDPHQAIYGFTGADNDALEIIKKEFNAITLPLTVTYRCPKAVVDHAHQWVKHITAHESAPDGIVEQMEYKDFFAAAQPGDAVLCRYNKYLVSACFKFIREGRAAKIEGRAIGAGLIALISKWKARDLNVLIKRVEDWQEREVAKYVKKGKESKADEVKDRADTLLILIENAQKQGITTIEGLKGLISSLFDENVTDQRNMITLCSVHRSKGLEWDNVFILGRSELMGKHAKLAWQTQQERNLIYVAVTRSQKRLVEVNNIIEEKRR